MASSAGRTLGRYRLERLVGRGGMAEVWEARDQTLGRRVAVEIILPDLAADSRFHERFLSEARSVAALEHANVLPIYDFGEADGEPYLVMPFLESGTLAERLKQGAVSSAQAIDWIRQLAAALDAAHAAGVLHRDVKPANVMIAASGRLLLADFGIAKSSQSGNLTATGLALGTPAYMAPELARGEAATSASDRYALGVLAYELVCGRPPFAGDNPLALLHQHLTTPVPAVSGVRPDLPIDLDPVFARILGKEPIERPPTCDALADEIARAFGGHGAELGALPALPPRVAASRPDDVTLAAPPPGAAAGSGAVVDRTAPLTPVTRRMEDAAPAAASSAGAASPEVAGRRRPVAIAVAALVALAIAVGLMLWSRQGSGPAGTSSAADSSAGFAPASGEPGARGADDDTAASTASSAAEGVDDVAARAPENEPAKDGAAASQGSAAESATGQRAAVPPPAAAAAAAASKVASPPSGSPSAAPKDAAPEASATDASGDAPDGTADAAPASDSSLPARPASGHGVAPPAEALVIFDLIGDAWRQGRFHPVLFAEIEKRMPALRAATGTTPTYELLESWVKGGKALIAGDRDAARDAVRSFFAIENPPEWSKLLPARFLPHHRGRPTDWQVALFWADPRGEARQLVDDALRATANERNLLLARAVVEHLDGHHAEAARQAVALDPLARGPARLLLARFAGDQLLWSGDVPAAVSWYKRLLVAPDRTEIAAALRTLSEEGGPQLIARACAEGFQPACDAGRSHPLQRARRARQQP